MSVPSIKPRWPKSDWLEESVSGCGSRGFLWSVRTEHFAKVVFQTRVMCFGSFLPLEWEAWRIGELVKRVFVAGIEEVSQYRLLMLSNVTPCHYPGPRAL